MTSYPLIVRNRAPWILRGFMLFWMAALVAFTIAAAHEQTNVANWLLPYVLSLFWLAGGAALVAFFRMEIGVVIIDAPGRLRVCRGPFYRRTEDELPYLELRFVTDRDSDGDPYYKLMLTAPPRPLTVAEGHDRARLDLLQRVIEQAHAGVAVGEEGSLA